MYIQVYINKKKNLIPDYEISEKIGKGASGDVFKAYKKVLEFQPKEKFAIKISKLHDLNSLQQLKIEVGLMKISNHENIVACFEAYIYEKSIFFKTN